MAKYICKNPSCQKIFDYCRACIFKPIYYHEAGYCSKECLVEERMNEKEVKVETEVLITETKPKKIKASQKKLIIEDIIPVVEVESQKIVEDIVPHDEIPEMEDASSFGTDECISDEDIETALCE